MILFTIRPLNDWARLTRRQIPKIKAMLDTTSDSYSTMPAINTALDLPLLTYIHTIAGTATLSRHTTMFIVLKQQL